MNKLFGVISRNLKANIKINIKNNKKLSIQKNSHMKLLMCKNIKTYPDQNKDS